jgi:hypothetical protein
MNNHQKNFKDKSETIKNEIKRKNKINKDKK